MKHSGLSLNRTGMSLAEVLVSICILSMMIFSIAGGISLTFSSVRVDRDITDAMSFAQQKIEHIRSDIIDTSRFSSLSDIPYSFTDIENSVTSRLIYDVSVSTLEGDSLKKVTLRVYYHDKTSATPQPSGNKLIQLSTFISRK
ncbi:MAG: hypothetical protein ABRQ39_11195 [Candidatus Eremiobacterota bacterium]